MAELSHRARLYKKINDDLSEDDVRSLRSMLVADGHLGQARVENTTPLEMFNMLEADNKIGKGNLALLVDLLKTLGKTKLAGEAGDVAKHEGTGGPSCTVEDVITCLKDLYASEHARVRPLPWCEDLNLSLEDVYTNLQHQRRDDRGRFEDTDTIVSLGDIYKTNKARAKNADAGTYVRRIRVEGDPGIGKSCSCQKLAHDWSSGKMDMFKAVFFLEIRHMRPGKVKHAIFEQLLPEDTNMTPDQLWSYIQENQDDVLFILDGLDELSQVARESTDVVALIQGKILRNCHVLVTSRPYHCVKDLEKCHEFYKIVGYSKENSVEFIEKYFRKTPRSAKKLKEQLNCNPNLSRIVSNPLNNVLICIVWEDNEGRLPSSPAELYQMIVYSVAKRYCVKKNIPLESTKIPPNIEETLLGLGKLSWEGLQQDQLQFNIDDIKEKYGMYANDMLAIGLLTRDNSVSRIKRTCFCAFLHKTFQEYMAAYYISELVRKEGERKEGMDYIRSLFGMTKAAASNVDMKLMSTNRERYREVQSLLLAMLGDSLGPLFEMFAEELRKDGCKGEVKDILSFFCIMFLGTACKDSGMGCEIVQIVAPILSHHITNDVHKYLAYDSPRADHAEWFDGLIQLLRYQTRSAMNNGPRLIQHVTFHCDIVTHLQQQQLQTLEAAISDCDTISCVTLICGRMTLIRTLAEKLSYLMGFRSERQGFPPFRTFMPRRGTESVHIDIKSTDNSGSLSMGNMLEDLSEIQSLQHVNIDIEYDKGADFSQYDSRLADMVMKLSSLRSLKVKIGQSRCWSEQKSGFGNLTQILHNMSEHTTLEVVEIEHPLNIEDPLNFSAHNGRDRIVTFDVEAMVHKLAECVTKNKSLKRLRLTWKLVKCYELFKFFVHPTPNRGACSSQSLSDLCSAILRNRTLETLTIDGMFSESEGHQEIIDQLMGNKPANFEELRIAMIRTKQYTQLSSESADSPSCSTDSISSELTHVKPSTSTGISGHRYDLRTCRSSKTVEVRKRSYRSQSLENTMKRKKKQKR